MKRLSLIFVVLSMFAMNGCGGDVLNYLDALKALRGTSYWTLQCSAYITTAKRFHHCGAAGFWSTGCGGALAVVDSADSFDRLNKTVLQPGDVIAFHGVHVAVYVGGGEFMDSDPVHNGVGDMTPNAIPGDMWFVGKVKVLRWKS